MYTSPLARSVSSPLAPRVPALLSRNAASGSWNSRKAAAGGNRRGQRQQKIRRRRRKTQAERALASAAAARGRPSPPGACPSCRQGQRDDAAGAHRPLSRDVAAACAQSPLRGCPKAQRQISKDRELTSDIVPVLAKLARAAVYPLARVLGRIRQVVRVELHAGLCAGRRTGRTWDDAAKPRTRGKAVSTGRMGEGPVSTVCRQTKGKGRRDARFDSNTAFSPLFALARSTSGSAAARAGDCARTASTTFTSPARALRQHHKETAAPGDAGTHQTARPRRRARGTPLPGGASGRRVRGGRRRRTRLWAGGGARQRAARGQDLHERDTGARDSRKSGEGPRAQSNARVRADPPAQIYGTKTREEASRTDAPYPLSNCSPIGPVGLAAWAWCVPATGASRPVLSAVSASSSTVCSACERRGGQRVAWVGRGKARAREMERPERPARRRREQAEHAP